MQEFLDTLILGNRVNQWLYALSFMLGGLAAGKITSLIVSGLLIHVCRKTTFKFDDIILGTTRRPLILLIMTGGIALGLKSLTLNDPTQLWVDRLLGALIIMALAWGMSAALDALIMHYVPLKGADSRSKRETDVQPLLRKLCKTVIWIIAGALILKALGYNVSALMAGLGLGGAALALASKDTLANFFGSITVFVDRPFRINDRIKIVGYEGFITEMGIRTSRLRTLENRTVIIPNSVFAANPIENITAALNTKISQTLSIKTDSGRQKLLQALSILQDIGSTLKGTCETPAVGVAGVGGSVYQISFIFYIAKDADYTDTINRINLEILARFEEAGILLA